MAVCVDAYRRDGLRIQKWRTGADPLVEDGDVRPLMGKRRDLEDPVREIVAESVADRHSGAVGGGRGAGVLVWQDTCHLKTVTADVL